MLMKKPIDRFVPVCGTLNIELRIHALEYPKEETVIKL